MAYSNNTVEDARAALMCLSTDKNGAVGQEFRKLGFHEADQHVADGQVKASAGTLFGFFIVFKGVTVDDQVEISNSLDGSSGVKFTVIAHTTDETHFFQIPDGMVFDTGIYHNESKTSGTIYATYVYR